MADFARVLAAVDATGVTNGALEQFLKQQGRIAGEVVEGDPFATTVAEFVRRNGTWEGRASELLAALSPEGTEKRPRDWPKDNSVTGRLKRLVPALRMVGVAVDIPTERSNRGRILRLSLESKGEQPSQPSQVDGTAAMASDTPGDGSGGAGDDLGMQSDGPDTDSVGRPAAIQPGKHGSSDGGDDSDGLSRQLSNAGRRSVRL
jgi:hypothetical protein